jgi:hypothetical protein
MEPVEILNGIFSAIFVAVSLSVGGGLIYKGVRRRVKTHLLVGATWIFMSELWMPSTLSFLLFLLAGDTVSEEVRVLIGPVGLPLGMLAWFWAVTELLYNKKKRVIMVLVAAAGFLFELVFLYQWIRDPSTVGRETSPIDVNYTLFVNVYLIVLLLLVTWTGASFARVTRRSPDPDTRRRGSNHLAAWLLFATGAVLDLVSAISVWVLVLGRLLLIAAAILFYWSFYLPPWMRAERGEGER